MNTLLEHAEPHDEPSHELFDLRSAAEFVGLTNTALNARILQGRLRGRRIGHKWFVERAELETLLAQLEGGRIRSAIPAMRALADHDGATVEELAGLLRRPRRTVLGWLQLLDREGLIERRRSHHPRDPAHCHLTAAGRAFLNGGRRPT